MHGIQVETNLSIVIIGQNEAGSILKMLAALKNLLPESPRIWILDRCTDNSEELLKNANETYYLTSTKLKGRQTSFARNLGLSKCDKTHDILFLDGDRYPCMGTLKGLLKWQLDIGLLLLEWDDRLFEDFNLSYGRVNNNFFSCGLFIKRTAINKILTFQKGELFKESIQKDWGIEDVYLGDVCYHLDLTCDYFLHTRLCGKFSKLKLDSNEVLKERFKLRQKLKVIW